MNTGWSKRIVFSVAGAVLLGLVVACSDEESATGTPSAPVAPAASASNEQQMSLPQSGPALTPAMKQLIKDAQAEGTLDITETILGEPKFLSDVEKAMNTKYGIKIRLEAGAGSFMGAMVSRIVEERKAGQPPSSDVLYVSPQSQLNLSRGGGVVTGINWKQYDPAITDFEIVDDSSGLILFADSIGLVYNTEVIAPKDVPKTVEELQDPKWKGLVTTTPYGTGWGEWAFFVGPDKAFEVARGIAKNVGGTTGSTDFGPIISGQFPIMAWTGSTQKALMDKEKGAPIDIVRPDFVYFLSSVVVIDGTPHPNLAKLFILFLRTTEGQDILWKHNRQDSPYLMGRHIWAQIQDALDNPNVRIHLETQSSLKKWPGGGLDAYFGFRKKINKLMKQGG